MPRRPRKPAARHRGRPAGAFGDVVMVKKDGHIFARKTVLYKNASAAKKGRARAGVRAARAACQFGRGTPFSFLSLFRNF